MAKKLRQIMKLERDACTRFYRGYIFLTGQREREEQYKILHSKFYVFSDFVYRGYHLYFYLTIMFLQASDTLSA